MTKRNPVPPGMRKKHYNYYRCSCGLPYIADIPDFPTRPPKDSTEPDFNNPSVLVSNKAQYTCKKVGLYSTAGWLSLIAVAFCVGASISLLLLMGIK